MPKVRIITMGCAKNEVDSDHMRARLESAGFSVESSSMRNLEADASAWVGAGGGAGAAGDADDAAGSNAASGGGTCSGGGADACDCAAPCVPDITIVNTCSFITGATQESIDAVFAVIDERSGAAERGMRMRDGGSKIVVAGCMPSRYGDELEQEIPEVDAFVGVDGEESIVQVVRELLGAEGCEGDARDGSDARDARDARDGCGKDAGHSDVAARTAREPFAYVKISDGCDRFCSFCTIPFIRGRYKSRTARQIVDEVGFLVGNGVREIVLIGQDTGVWGDDLCGPDQAEPLGSSTLPALLDYLAQSFEGTWFRVMYLQPERIDDALLHVIVNNPNVCSYLDIPLQHASAKVIGEMHRAGSGREYLELIDHVRKTVPGVALRTTMIAGFPGETDDEAAELEDFMRDAAFDFAGVFEYSREDGTVAGERPDQIDSRVATERANSVREAIEECSVAKACARVGNVYDVLVCGVVGTDDEFESNLDPKDAADGEAGLASDACAVGEAGANVANVASVEAGEAGVARPAVRAWGRTMFQAPEVDSVVYFDAPQEAIGMFVKVRVVGAVGLDLEGEIV